MASVLERLAAPKSITTSFECLTPTVRVENAEAAQKLEPKKLKTMTTKIVLQINAQIL